MSTTAEETGTIRDDIRASGLRATPARLATLKLRREADSPVTHADVAEHLEHLGVDKATAFRNLSDMTDAGLLRRTELGDHVYRFEAIDEEHGPNHPHFVCVDCGTVSCMDDVKLTAGSKRQSDAIGEVMEILFRGHCNDCK